VFYRGNRVQYFLSARLYERALEEFERLQELAPAFVSPPVWLTYFMLGRLEEAHRVSVAVYKRCGRPCDSLREALESGWNEGGWEGAQRAWLEVAREGAAPFGIATRYALIGEKDEAFAWLERGYRERDPLMIVLRTAPYLDPLRSDPRFQDLLRRIGFPED
jgi:tetratricopeptide (TPR) repeat protein